MKPMTYKSAPLPLKSGFFTDNKGFFSGYGSIFKVIDRHGDRVMPGAFRRSLSYYFRQKTLPKMFHEHDQNQEIGKWYVVKEDMKGLFVAGQLDLENPRAREVYDKIRRQEITGLSIGYYPCRTSVCPLHKNRLLHEVDLVEISVVESAANPIAKIHEIKAFLERMWSRVRRIES